MTVDNSLSIEVFEDAVSDIFRYKDRTLADSDIDRLSELLLLRGKKEWALRPRTYAVLRMMNRLNAMGTFIHKQLNDFNIPYTVDRLASVFSDSSSRDEFVEKQSLVMTKESGKAYDLERNGGRHRHFDASSHFEIIRLLGRGGFGEVDCVRSKLSLREYARKRVHRVKAFAKEHSALKQFENEVHELKRLRHHHLVKFIGSYTDPKYVGLITSPVADYDLRVFLSRQPFTRTDAELLRGFFGCLCSAVSYLHKEKCRHKDIKPANILIKGQTVLLTDFGTARDWNDMSKSTTVDRPGPFTPAYAAPEVAAWGPRNTSSDIYSLGMVFLDMTVSLRVPHQL
ncbi:kinase-like protein [Lepidopterella palustris CBS 459.81]|uniref:Kinase-like protein n=1 Tax=Lepidopterella palustris CBS 459.81 TaxID=1314670 RepID=A0A8E2E410_9PEZI|nr:kinase-like protein [Lepidopterella palustris CBS 459.81]